MKLLTKELEEKIPRLYTTENTPQDKKILQIKYFTPDSNWSWYVTEYDPNEKVFFGLVIGFEKEWGYFSLEELENIKGPLGLHIERDTSFKPITFKDFKKLNRD